MNISETLGRVKPSDSPLACQQCGHLPRYLEAIAVYGDATEARRKNSLLGSEGAANREQLQQAESEAEDAVAAVKAAAADEFLFGLRQAIGLRPEQTKHLLASALADKSWLRRLAGSTRW